MAAYTTLLHPTTASPPPSPARLQVRIFLIFFFLYLTCFWAALYLNYPRAGTGILNVVPQFNSMRDSFEAMVSLRLSLSLSPTQTLTLTR